MMLKGVQHLFHTIEIRNRYKMRVRHHILGKEYTYDGIIKTVAFTYFSASTPSEGNT